MSAFTGFARHELRLAWRDWAWIFSGWRNQSTRRALVGMAIFTGLLHLIGYAVLSPFFARGGEPDRMTLVILTVSVILSFTMLLSQAMESVTRAFYARDDLDLILSSPAPSRDLFLVRIGMMGLTGWVMSVLMVAPFINVAAVLGGPRWLAGYGVMLAVALLATGVAILLTLALFRWVGARRTRLIAQITAAVIGAAFLIGLQVVAIVSYGSMSRLALFDPDGVARHAPEAGSPLWMPAHALTGQVGPLMLLLGISLAFFAVAAWIGATRFRRIVVRALGVQETARRRRGTARPFRTRSTGAALMHKELRLIGRDPWLISQTLMQVLYLLPPAVMLWVSFGSDTQVAVIVAPVVVMAVGQLAGGLAWLTISGEDAPDLIATAPVASGVRLWAKVRAVLVIVAGVVSPLAIGLATVSPWGAIVTFLGALTAASCAILVQLWFRAQAKRTMFRRRQVASRVSTIAEAVASILCAGTTALVAASQPLAIIPALLLLVVMGIVRGISPKERAIAMA